ncbi:hypothetical protein [Sphingomonas sp.]|uniref:hypothetical protein n=1 Tax=Sphingomonas sp. TaxID=28214 RepID=UPI0035BBD4C3
MAYAFPVVVLHRANQRLHMALAAYHNMLRPYDFNQFKMIWSDFMSNTGAVIHALEAGSKGSPQLRQWYGNLKREMRNEPFLKYMYQARNANAHSASRMLGVRLGQRSLPGRVFVLEETINVDAKGHTLPPSILMSEEGNQVDTTGGVVVLWRVLGKRHGDIYDVPICFRGKALAPDKPHVFAALYQNYLSDLVKTAAALEPAPRR